MTKEIHIINYYDEFGNDYDKEYDSLEEAIEGLLHYQSCYEHENGGSFNNLMSEPSLYHPDGSGRFWSLDISDWI